MIIGRRYRVIRVELTLTLGSRRECERRRRINLEATMWAEAAACTVLVRHVHLVFAWSAIKPFVKQPSSKAAAGQRQAAAGRVSACRLRHSLAWGTESSSWVTCSILPLSLYRSQSYTRGLIMTDILSCSMTDGKTIEYGAIFNCQ